MAEVAIYVRLSDEDRFKEHETDESESIQNQKSMLKEYCKERDWNIYDIYNDEDYSGADNNRPEFNRMLRDCESGKINIVLCKSQSRFSRDMEIIEKYLHNKFIEWDIRFIGVVDHADTNDVANKKSRQINGLMNEWYLEDTSENIKRTLNHKRSQGEFTGSFAPYGYSVDISNKNHLVVDTEVSGVVRAIFEWTANGWGYRKVVQELNNRNIPSPTAYKQQSNSNYKNVNEASSYNQGLWTQSTIYTIIRNETYIGNLVQGKTHYVSYKNRKRLKTPKEKWIRVENTHEPIISIELWNRVQNKINSRIRSSRITKEVTPLSGKVKCAVCGQSMKRSVYYNTTKTIQYYGLTCGSYKVGSMSCPNSKMMSGKKLEEIIIGKINNLLKEYLDESKISLSDNSIRQKQKLEQQIRECSSLIQQKENNLVKLYEDKLNEIISLEQYKKFESRFNQDIEKLKEQISLSQTQLDTINNEIGNQDKFKEVIKKYTHVDKISRELVLEFIDMVYIGEVVDNQREINIKWNF